MLWTVLLLLQLWATTQAQLPEANITASFYILAPGDSTSLFCSTSRTTEPVEWRRSGMPVENSNTNSNTLHITNFGEDLAGNYTCVARNDFGMVSSNTAILQVAVHTADFFSTSITSPHEVTVTEGVSTAVDCGPFINTGSPSNIRWEVQFGMLRHSLTLANDGATVGLNNSMYLLEPTMEATGGVFVCELTNPLLGDISTGYVRVTVEASASPPSDPFILVSPHDVVTWVGQTVAFECIPGGRNAATMAVQWSPRPTGGRMSNNGLRLTIVDVREEHAGTYTCTINGLTSSATLHLIDVPELTSQLPTPSVSRTYGDLLSLSCATSTPDATYWEWFFNASRLPAAGPSMTVESVTLENAGTYQCIAYNEAGHSQSATMVNVNTIPARVSFNFPIMQLVFRHRPFSMSCIGQGAPPPSYTWLKSSTPLETGSSFEVSTDGTLLIRNVESSSEGVYTCMVTNTLPNGAEVGSDGTSTILSTINPTVIIEEIRNPFSVQVALPAILPCIVQKDPRASVQFFWLKDGQPLDISGRFSFRTPDDGSLYIESVEFSDQGSYQCFVNTTLEDIPAPSVHSSISTVEVTATPVAPIILSLNSTSPNSFYIEWFFSGMPTFVHSYIVEVKTPPNSNASWVPVHTRSVSSVAAADIRSDELSAFTLYNVRVVANYSDGTLVSSEEQMLQTDTDIPADSPRKLTGTAPNNKAIALSWDPPAIPNGEIIGYVIQYRMRGGGDYIPITTSNITEYVIEDLKEFEKFEVRVAALTSAGQGPFSGVVEVATVEGGVLAEPQAASFVSTIGFIVLMVAVILLVVVLVVVMILVCRYRCSKDKEQRRYHFRHSGYFGNKVNILGLGVGTNTTDTSHLSDDAMASYATQRRAFGSTSPVSSRAEQVEFALEGESGFGGSVATGTPQLSVGSSARLMNGPAPCYINPPSFEQTVMHGRSRSQSASSAYQRQPERPEWDQKFGMDYIHSGFSNPYEDSENSIEKNPDDFSDETDRESEHTQYSHLAGMGDQRSPREKVSHHQLTLPLSASSSAGVPMTVGEMVDNRLLRMQSEDLELPGTCATNV